MSQRLSWLIFPLLVGCVQAKVSGTSGSGTSGSHGASTSGSHGSTAGSSSSTNSTSTSSTGSSGSSTGGTGTTLAAGYPNLDLPTVGTAILRVISPTVLDLELITTKDAAPAPIRGWDFVDSSGNASALPLASNFVVKVDGQPDIVQQVGFKRRPLYAPLSHFELRIDNHIYLTLSTPLEDQQSITVDDASGALWTTPTPYTASVDPMRYGPSIHVSQAGYLPSGPKRAMVGFYLGSLGELPSMATTFSIVNAHNGASVFQGTLNARLDQGFGLSPAPYQQVLEADFSSFQTPGEYQLVVPGQGASYPFLIDDGVAAALMRTYEEGIYNQRCGMAKTLPFTRFVDGADHMAPASIPTMDPSFDAANQLINENSSVPTGQTAPQLMNVAASLFPFVQQGTLDVSGGHHDAGDYSKYVTNSAKLVHTLTFIADNFPGVGALDNLGIPESGDGKSDILQEAKWEADFLVKMQDTDGAFFNLVYPRDRAYEQDVLPSHGDPQIVWPKTTLETAAATAALAEIGSSPLFAQQFPAEAANYLQHAHAGWSFLISAMGQYGRMGCYQYLYQYGSEFLQDDELDWAAAAMFVATGDQTYLQTLEQWFPNPDASSTFEWGWWRMWEGYGSAIRDIAFSVNSGRLQASQVDASYLAACQAEVQSAGQDQLHWAQRSSYGTSYPDASKALNTAGWYFSPSQAFDIAVANVLSPDPSYVDAILTNFNYETGANPLNLSFLSGIGWQRPREMVSQFFENDRHRLPPTGIDYGNLASGFSYTATYGTELGTLVFPSNGASQSPYPLYDRYSHNFNVTTEAVTMNMAWGLAAISAIAAQGPIASQSWSGMQGTIDAPGDVPSGEPVTVKLNATGIDLSKARVTWEAKDVEPWAGGTQFTLTPTHGGPSWIEAEAMLPDGRRIVAVKNDFQVTESVPASQTIEAFNSGVDLSSDPKVVGWYQFDGSLADTRGNLPSTTLVGNAALDSVSFAWPNRLNGGAVRVFDLGDELTATFPASALARGSAVSVQAMIYVNHYKAYGHGNATLLQLYDNWNSLITLQENEWTGLQVGGGQGFSVPASTLTPLLTTGTWHHVKLELSSSGYSLEIDGTQVSSLASSDLANWQSGNVTLTAGDFDGWVDELVIEDAP